jgi:hypothetical protein
MVAVSFQDPQGGWFGEIIHTSLRRFLRLAAGSTASLVLTPTGS